MFSFVHESSFYELTAILSLAAGVGVIGLLLRQPMIVSFIAVGVLAGPSAMGIVRSNALIELLAELGVAVLLFLVGLKLDIKLIKTLGVVSLATGLGQVLFTSIIGFFIGLALGLNVVTAIYVAVALTFSSTIIIIKLLSDKKEVDSLHGRIAVGFLIVQDLVVVIAMVVLSALGISSQAGSGNGGWLQIGEVLFYGAMLVLFVGIFARYLATALLGRIAKSSELLVVFSIGWAALFASIGDHFGFSKELGGLLAGVSLASTPFREAIVARLSSMRDFLLLFFFIALGSKLDLGSLGSQVFPALVLSLFVLIGNPLIVLSIMGYMGYRKRTGFLAGLTVAQISEFSLIFMAMGVSLGHLASDSLGLVTFVGLITIALSVYMITYSHNLYRWLEPALFFFERKLPLRESTEDVTEIEQNHYEVILFGLGRYGAALAQHLRKRNIKMLAVDFNPEEVRRGREIGYDVVYGDACDQELTASLPLSYAKWVVSAIPPHEFGLTHEDPRRVLIDALKRQNFLGRIAVSSNHPSEAEGLRQMGADLIFLPFYDAAEQAVDLLTEKTNIT